MQVMTVTILRRSRRERLY